jgi:hypothetical protein
MAGIAVRAENTKPPQVGFGVQDCSRPQAPDRFQRFIRFLTEGFVKYARFTFRTPERSYFFLKRLIARSMSFSETTMPTNRVHLRAVIRIGRLDAF